MAISRTQSDYFDCCVIGGGFFGCSLATFLAKQGKRVVLLEQGQDYFQRASFNNQARVHNGYHYPRHFLTAVRSRVNFSRFARDFKESIVTDFDQFYAISSHFSKVTAAQFENLITRVGAPIEKVKPKLRQLFNPDLIEAIFCVQEYVFDANQLKKIAMREMLTTQVRHHLRARVNFIARTDLAQLKISWSHSSSPENQQEELQTLITDQVYNCTYSGLNNVLQNSGMQLIHLKHEISEICLIRLPPELMHKSITVMCGPFFSIMPFPAYRGDLYTLSHVRYTPHAYWYDHSDLPYRSPYDYLQEFTKLSRHQAMIKDAIRYVPLLSKASYVDSLWEVKTTLPSTEENDGRPILFHNNTQLPGLTSILGGKIDNIYDVYEEITRRGF